MKNIKQIVKVITNDDGVKRSLTTYAPKDSSKPYPNGGRGKMMGLKAVDTN